MSEVFLCRRWSYVGGGPMLEVVLCHTSNAKMYTNQES